MPRLKCNDVDCQGYNVEELIPHIKYLWNPDTGKLEADKAKCPICGKQRDPVKEPGPIVIPWFKAENSKNYQNRKVEGRTNKYNY